MANFFNKIVIISGATASGKSKLAIDFAIKKNGVIINADALQQYRDLKILSAIPSKEMQQKILHRLYGYLDFDCQSNVALWLENVQREIKNCWQNYQLPIVVGGTGFYLRVLIDGINYIPSILPQIKKQAQDQLAEFGYSEFKRRYGDNKIIDKQRLIRACEVLLQTQKPLKYWQSQPKQKIFPDANFVHLNLAIDRKIIYQNCNQRFDNMLKSGAIEEVEALLKKNIDLTMPITKTLGFVDIEQFLTKKISYQQMQENVKQKTRNYAKRQITWFKHQFREINFFSEDQLALKFLEETLN